MKTFSPGTTYTAQSAVDSDTSFSITVAKRTAKTITTTDGKRCGIHVIADSEVVFADGRYSMCPVYRASNAQVSA